MPTFDVNNDNIIALTAKLERLNKSAFPSAVRNTLNNAAFQTKNEIPITAAKVFVTREKTFFKRFSIVDKAEGWNINKMVATVGINASLNKELAENLESQEFGGMVKGRKLIPHDEARSGGSQNKRVSPANRHPQVKIHDATPAFKAHKGTRNSKFIAAIMSTAKSGKTDMMLSNGPRGMVYRMTKLSSSRKTGKLNFKLKKLYSVRRIKNHTVESSKFVERSALQISKNIDDIFVKNAEFQFKKHLK